MHNSRPAHSADVERLKILRIDIVLVLVLVQSVVVQDACPVFNHVYSAGKRVYSSSMAYLDRA
jgi:hypothetical protein